MNDIQYFRTFALIEEGQPDIPKNYVVRVVLAKHYDAALSREVLLKREMEIAAEQVCASEDREAALREELAEVKRHVKQADMVFNMLRIACDATGETTALVYSKLGDMLNAKAEAEALQQRLTVSEQRAGVMEKALMRIARPHDCGCLPCTGDCTSKLSLEITVDAMREIAISALKPAEEVESWKQLAVGDTVEYLGSGDSREDCYSCMTIGNKYSITEAPDDFGTMVVLDDDGDEISVISGDFRRIKP